MLVDLDSEIQLPPDMTRDEIFFIKLVKQRMLQKLNDRHKFIFLYCIEMGNNQRAAAEVLQVHETLIAKHMKQIRKILGEFRSVKNYKD